MTVDRIVNVLAMIVGLAMVTTIVSRPNSANVIRAMGDTFTRSLRAAMRDL